MSTENDNLLKRIEASLDTMRPYLNDDGGNVEVLEVTKDMVVKVRLLGACSTCPQSIMTMKAGIEEAVKRAVPEVRAVEAVNLTPVSEFEL
ncbi:MAG: NifU family protein [Chitinophagales bacterium]